MWRGKNTFIELVRFIGFNLSLFPLSFLISISPPLASSSLLRHVRSERPKEVSRTLRLDQQNNWCGPCRCVFGVPAGVLEQVTAGELSRWYLLPLFWLSQPRILSTPLPLPISFCKSGRWVLFFIARWGGRVVCVVIFVWVCGKGVCVVLLFEWNWKETGLNKKAGFISLC